MSGSVNNITATNTDEIAAKSMRVESADLSKQTPVSHGHQLQLPAPPAPPPPLISPVEENRRRCKLYYLLTDNTCEEELNDIVTVADNCLVQQGVLPINTPDDNDAAEKQTLQSRLQSSRYRLVFKRAYILFVLTVCPIFFNMLVTDYAVNSERLAKFVNDPASDFSKYCLMYVTGEVRDADMLVALALVKWTQEMGC